MYKKINIIHVFLVVSVLCSIPVISTARVYDFPVDCQGLQHCQSIMPAKTGLYLGESQTHNILPRLVLTVPAGSGCDQVSTLRTSRNLRAAQPNIFTKGGHVDILEIEIHGYQILRGPGSADITCPDEIKEAMENIELADYMSGSSLQLKIILNGKANFFDLGLSDGVLFLNPLDSSNIFSFIPGENISDKPLYCGMMTNAFLGRLARVRVQGVYAQDSDLDKRLRNYMRESGFIPLDEKLQGYPPMKPLEDFIVLVPFDPEHPDHFKTIGQIKYHEIIAGDKLIDVGIERAVVYPYFVRNR